MAECRLAHWRPSDLASPTTLDRARPSSVVLRPFLSGGGIRLANRIPLGELPEIVLPAGRIFPLQAGIGPVNLRPLLLSPQLLGPPGQKGAPRLLPRPRHTRT